MSQFFKPKRGRGRPKIESDELEIVNYAKLVHHELERNGGKKSPVRFAYSNVDGALCLSITNKRGEDVEVKHSAQFISDEEGVQSAYNTVKSWGYGFPAYTENLIKKGIL